MRTDKKEVETDVLRLFCNTGYSFHKFKISLH